MKTQKGYVIPAVLIIILLILAGFVTFGLSSKTPAPIVENKATSTPVTATNTQPTFEEEDDIATTTATTSVEIDIGGEPIVQ